MIYITGDCHSEFQRLKNINDKFDPEEVFKPEDFIIVCGDMGLLWKKNSWDYEYNCRVLEKVIPTVLFVPGNHENYDWIEEFPVTEWHGGKVRKILGDKVIMLERGQIFDIEGHRFFAFGGASSHDYDELLDPNDPDYPEKKEKAIWTGKRFRTIGKTWWPQELPTVDERMEGINQLDSAGWEVDYVVTHCCSTGIQDLLKTKIMRGPRRFKPDRFTDYLDTLEKHLEYKHWFFGHYHENMQVDEKHTVLYEDIIKLPLG